ncbi:MAG TPA: TonB-dependent receptor [Cellvibrio sp.]|nr:TonB-dependent receptor [Cellvibrio sp.]
MIKPSGITTRKKALVLAIGCALYGVQVYAQEPVVPAVADEAVEEVIVKGVRASQAKAIDIKRNSSVVVDSIVAEDIGKLPDTTITDSLQRVTGVQITREANEGTSLNVRGMPQVLTTLNGEQFLSPWTITGVGANYSDVPAGLISGADVYKSQSANSLAGGISGLVDLKTLSPLTLKDWMVRARIEGSMGDMSDKETNKDGSTSTRDPDHNVSIFVGNNFDDVFAFTLSGFNSTTYNANYSMWETARLAFLDQRGGTPRDPLDFDGDGDTVGDWYLTPESFSAKSNYMDREREGGAFTFESNIAEGFTLRGDVFYTSMAQYDRGVNVGFNASTNPNYYEVNGVRAPREGTNDLLIGYDEQLYNVLLPSSEFGDSIDFSYVDKDGVTQNRSLHALNVARIDAADFQTSSTNESNRTGALNTNLQLKYTNGDNFDASVRYIYAEAEKHYRKATFQQGTPAWLWVDEDVDVDGNPIPGKDPLNIYSVTVDYSRDVPSFAFDDDLSNANLLKQYQGFADGSDTNATLNVARIDAKFSFNDNFWESVEGGLRWGERQADYTKFYYVTPTARYSNWDDPRVPVDKRYKLRTGNQIWQKYPEWRKFEFAEEPTGLLENGLVDNGFSAANTAVFTDFGPIKGFEGGVSSLDPSEWDNPLAFLNKLYPGTKTANDPGYTYDVTEETTTAFAQLNFNSEDGIAGIPFKGNFGAQFIRTDRTVIRAVVPDVLDKYNSVGYDDWQKIAFVAETETIEHSFNDVLPSLNLNFFPQDDVVVRVGAAKTTSRNDLNNVGSGLVLWYQQCDKLDEDGNPIQIPVGGGQTRNESVSCVGGGNDDGNPYIKPWYANVYNTSTEWYFDENAMLAAGLFLIEVDTSTEQTQEMRPFTDGDGIDRDRTANIYTTRNVGASDLYGFEMGYKQPFTFLPGEILSSTGLEFNYTYSKSKSNNIDIEGNALPLPSNSEHQSNLILWYDRDGLNLRLAYNWRSEEYLGRVGLNTNAAALNLGNWLEATGYLDFSANYWVNDHLEFSFNGANLTGQNRRSYAQMADQFQSLWVQERRYTLGMTVKL